MFWDSTIIQIGACSKNDQTIRNDDKVIKSKEHENSLSKDDKDIKVLSFCGGSQWSKTIITGKNVISVVLKSRGGGGKPRSSEWRNNLNYCN